MTDATMEINLEGIWSFTPEGGKKADIRVPGGGWIKQGFSCEAGTYERYVTIPDAGISRVIKLETDAVNHYAEYYIGENENCLKRIHEEVTAFTPQTVDLTPHVQPGKTYLLRIFVRAYQGGRPIAPHSANWCGCIARGLFRGIHIRIYPPVFLADAFVKTQVLTRTLRADVWITNASAVDQRVTVQGTIASWNGDIWDYPALPETTVIIQARSTAKVVLGPVEWKLGEKSYWWPNLPYREGYRSQLHVLQLSINENGHTVHHAGVRFGFREIRQAGKYYELNGVRINFRGDSLQVANYDRIDHGGRGDAIGTFPGFLPPSESNPGWPKAVDNFLRLNFNVQRQHMGPWTPYMLDVCDEMGLMLIGESASRLDSFDRENGRAPYEAKCLADIVRRDRNHPAIIRWGSVNEPQCDDPEYHAELYDAIKALDDTRPISEDIWSEGYLKKEVNEVFRLLLDKPDYTWIEHYLSFDDHGNILHTSSQLNDAVIPLADRPFGLGEADWDANGNPRSFVNFAATTVLVRAQDASDVRPYVLLSNWASSIPGVKTTDFVMEGDRFFPLYGEDNLTEPWHHEGIRLLQNAFHPLLAFDFEFWHLNRKSNGAGAFPLVLPVLKADTAVTREITVFNDELSGEEVEVICSLRSGSTSNRIFAEAGLFLTIPCGYSRKVRLEFVTPPLDTVVFLTIETGKRGTICFRDSLTCYEVREGVISEWNYAVGDDRSFDSLKLEEL